MPRRPSLFVLSFAVGVIASLLTAPSASALTLADVVRRSREGATVEELMAALREAEPPLTATESELAMLEAAQVDPRVVAYLRGDEETPVSAPVSEADAPPIVHRRAGHPYTGPMSRGGVVVGGGLGGNVCVADSDGSCAGLSPGVGVDLFLGYRFDWLSLAVDVDAGMLLGRGDTETAYSYTQYAVMPTVRLHLVLGAFELQLGAGVGYVGERVRGLERDIHDRLGWYSASTSADGEWHAFTGAKALLGAFVADVYPRLDVGLVAKLFLQPNEGEVCYTPFLSSESLVEPCDDASDAPLNEHLTISIQAVYRFPN